MSQNTKKSILKLEKNIYIHINTRLDASEDAISTNCKGIVEDSRRSRLRIKFLMCLQYFVYLIYFSFFIFV